LGVLPFFLFALLFMLLPTAYLMVGAFQDAEGHFTLANLAGLLEANVLDAYWISFKISVASSAAGGLLGFLLAWAAVLGKLPGWIRPTLMTFSGVASNFAGVPLAFAFLATLGRMGLVTILLRTYLDINIYSTGFSILSFTGLTLTYLYFQIPLMVLIVTPALEGLKKDRPGCGCETRPGDRGNCAPDRSHPPPPWHPPGAKSSLLNLGPFLYIQSRKSTVNCLSSY
jgi:putative spermidine/putrescine transport system permease protein